MGAAWSPVARGACVGHTFVDMSKLSLPSRLLRKLRSYTSEVQRSRQELSESPQERTLPPIPPGDHHQKKSRGSRR